MPEDAQAPLPAASLPERGIVSVSGSDAQDLLQSLVTVDVTALAPGRLAHGALLTPQGKVLNAFFLWRTDGGFLIDTTAETTGALVQRLTLYKLRAAAEIADVSAQFGVYVGDEGPDHAVADPRHADLGLRWLGDPTGEAADAGYDARRIRLGVPEFGRDYGAESVFPMDVNLDRLGAVDYRKGCFVGQEVASRMFRKGSVRKRSWLVIAQGEIAPGDPVTAGDSTLGEVTSVAGTAGIARLRVDRAETAEGTVLAGGVPVSLRAPDYLS